MAEKSTRELEQEERKSQTTGWDSDDWDAEVEREVQSLKTVQEQREQLQRKTNTDIAINQLLNRYSVQTKRQQTNAPHDKQEENQPVVERMKHAKPKDDPMAVFKPVELSERAKIDARKEERANSILKWVAIVSATLAIVTCIGLFVVPKIKTIPFEDKNEKAELDITKYSAYATAAVNATPNFTMQKWGSSADALDAFVNLINPGLPSDMMLLYYTGGSYAMGCQDPWGQPYYLTARALGDSEGETKYDFYITSGGKNKTFDTASLLLDADDITKVIFTMQPYMSMKGEHSTFNPNTIDSSNSIISRMYDTIPITFDFQGGEGDMTMIETHPGELLPNVRIPSKDGYVFAGYYTEPEGEGTKYYDSKGEGMFQSPFLEGTMLYAYWEIPEVKPPIEEVTEDQLKEQENANQGIPQITPSSPIYYQDGSVYFPSGSILQGSGVQQQTATPNNQQTTTQPQQQNPQQQQPAVNSKTEDNSGESKAPQEQTMPEREEPVADGSHSESMF